MTRNSFFFPLSCIVDEDAHSPLLQIFGRQIPRNTILLTSLSDTVPLLRSNCFFSTVLFLIASTTFSPNIGFCFRMRCAHGSSFLCDVNMDFGKYLFRIGSYWNFPALLYSTLRCWPALDITFGSLCLCSDSSLGARVAASEMVAFDCCCCCRRCRWSCATISSTSLHPALVLEICLMRRFRCFAMISCGYGRCREVIMVCMMLSPVPLFSECCLWCREESGRGTSSVLSLWLLLMITTSCSSAGGGRLSSTATAAICGHGQSFFLFVLVFLCACAALPRQIPITSTASWKCNSVESSESSRQVTATWTGIRCTT